MLPSKVLEPSLPDEFLELLRYLQAMLEHRRARDYGISPRGDVPFPRSAAERVLSYTHSRLNNNNHDNGQTPHSTSTQDLMRLANECTNGQSTFTSPSARRRTGMTRYGSMT
ncbi:uncharacterized protein CTHT_0008020 [Thermochaetoides thermophila DSM 1495]|uniref:Uncharacterized protein n=1 Tax=Chaetomium thermophilum (strain DSM 1495 / CBS 144.50 / IMI 039719) TaxID=759272 RepID=G0RZY0_CHATD|nr:hypothetical protein CTHT_0008020 [Thermochaetoides thermophila DSM 1495]EGS23141.1 hypothetical protein CTHT_0008020 [Thermochaetoides thermophila DSM 1495]